MHNAMTMTSPITLLLIVLAAYTTEVSPSGINSNSKPVQNEKSRIYELEIRGKVFERQASDQQPCAEPVSLTSVRVRIEPLGSILTANTDSDGLFSIDVPLRKDLLTDNALTTMPIIRLCKGADMTATIGEKQICSNARISSNDVDRQTATKHFEGVEGEYTVLVKYVIDAVWCLSEDDSALENAYSTINQDGANLNRLGEIERNDLHLSNEGQSAFSQNEGDVRKENEDIQNVDTEVKSENIGSKRTWGDSGMNWIKKSVKPQDAEVVNHGSGFSRNNNDEKKRMWGDAGASWMKRKGAKQSWNNPGALWGTKQLGGKRTWGDSGASWMKRDEEKEMWNRAGVDQLLKHDKNKRTWGDAGASWLKRRNEDQIGGEDDEENEEGKRTWGDAGASWMKRRNNDETGRDNEELLEEEERKRTWGDAGASWMKRENLKRAWGDNGMNWVKKDGGNFKRTWGDSGMGWIKRAPV